MSKKLSLGSDSIEETMLGPLWARATYSKLYPDLLDDQQAIQIIEKVDYEFTELANFLEEWRALGLLVRAKSFDEAIKNYLGKHPNSTVVNIGCGLDTTFSRVDNGTIKWLNIDLPSAIDFRNQYITEPSRCKNISKSVFDYSWMEDVEFSPENGIIFFAGGIVYYFKEEEIRKLITTMAEKYPGGELVFDAISKIALKIMNRRARKAGSGIRVHYDIGDPTNEFSNWSKNVELIDWYTIWTRTPINTNWSDKTLKMLRLARRLKTAKIIHLKFKA